MKIDTAIPSLGLRFCVLAFLAVTGCSSEQATSADITAKKYTKFKLNPGREDIGQCDASDRACYLGSLDLTNAYWLGAVSKTMYETKLDAAHPEWAFGGMTSKKKGLIDPGKNGALKEYGLAWREFVIFDDNLAKSTATYFETKDGVAVLAFRGTATDQGPANLIADADISQVCAESEGVEYCTHEGFRDNFHHLWSSGDWARYVPVTFCAAGTDSQCETTAASKKVVVRVEMGAYLAERFHGPNAPHALFITGHSLGGALATLALNEVLLDPNLIPANVDVAVYTYGTPRVGNAAFAEKVFEESRKRHIPYYRFVHRQDGVARVQVPGYAHLGLNPSGEDDGLDTFIHLVGADEREGKGETMSLGELDAEDPGGGLGDMLGDHAMQKYMAVLKVATKP